jgi:hypothetical protein
MGKGIEHAKNNSRGRFGRSVSLGKKNISKKEADVVKKTKSFQKIQRQVDRDQKKKEDFELRQLQKNKKNGLAQRRIEA